MLSQTENSLNTAARYFSILLLLLLVCVPSQALDPDIKVSQYAHTAWLLQDGYFNGAPRAITQTTDGYILIGTRSGLWRFDDSRFLVTIPCRTTKLLRKPSDAMRRMPHHLCF